MISRLLSEYLSLFHLSSLHLETKKGLCSSVLALGIHVLVYNLKSSQRADDQNTQWKHPERTLKRVMCLWSYQAPDRLFLQVSPWLTVFSSFHPAGIPSLCNLVLSLSPLSRPVASATTSHKLLGGTLGLD